MIETTQTITVVTAELVTDEDFIELLTWGQSTEGVYVTITATVTGDLNAEVGAITADTVRAQRGDTITWDGARFTVTSPEVAPVGATDPYANITPTDVETVWAEESE